MSAILWKPSKQRIENANISRFIEWASTEHHLQSYAELYRWSIEQPAKFWDLMWRFSDIVASKKGAIVVENFDRMPGARWFPDVRLNYAENLLKNRYDHQTAILFRGENGISSKVSYAELYSRVSQLALALRQDGVKAGDRVAGVLPNVVETVVAMLATASIGAVWSSCSPDFGVPAIVDRLGQIQAKVLFFCDGYYFNGKLFNCTQHIDQLINALPDLQKIVLLPYAHCKADYSSMQVVVWQDYLLEIPLDLPITFTRMQFSAPLFIMYSSGTTGLPKCIVHSIGGTLIQHLKEHLLHVDIHPGDRLFYFTTCGWMMWNWLVSGLASGAALVLYDGAPLYPKPDILFDLIDEYKINVLGVSAKYIDALQKSDIVPRQNHHLNSLATLLSTGSPLMPEGFDYVYDAIKADLCLASISGGTDILSCFVLGCPVLPVYRGQVQCLGLGMRVEVFAENGLSVQGEKGELVCTAPFPSMPIGFWNDPGDRIYHATYFKKYPNVWCHGDYVALTQQGGMIIYGRSDAVLNPGGVRIGTAEIYRYVDQQDEVIDSLVVGLQKKGDCKVILFVVLRGGLQLSELLKNSIKQHIKDQTSPRHVPYEILQVTDIPRTKSGKIVELTVRNILQGEPVKNQKALANPESLQEYYKIAEHLKTRKFS